MLSPLPTPVAPPAAPQTPPSTQTRGPASNNGAAGAGAGTAGFAQALDQAQAPQAEAGRTPGPAQTRLQAGKDSAKAGARDSRLQTPREAAAPAVERDTRRTSLPPEREAAEPERRPASGVQDLLAQMQTLDPAKAAALAAARTGPDGAAPAGDDLSAAARAVGSWPGSKGVGAAGESAHGGATRSGRAGGAQGLVAIQAAQAAQGEQTAAAAEDGLRRMGAAVAAVAAVGGGDRAAGAVDSATGSAANLAGAWAASSAAPGAGASSPAPAQARLDAPLGSPAFAQELGVQVTTFVLDGVQHARLHLNPAEMGPVSVQIQLDGQTAVVHLGAEQAHTRLALEQALPQLAGQLSEAGLTLAGGGVFEQTQQGRDGMGAGGQDSGSNGRGPTPWGQGLRARTDEGAQGPLRMLQQRGVVDLVA